MAVIKLIQQSMDKQASGEQCQKYGRMMDFLQVAVWLTHNFKQEFKCRQQLCCQAVKKLGIAARRVADMERTAQQWKDNLADLKTADAADATAVWENVAWAEREVELISCQIDRAKDLLASLSVYQERWGQQVVRLEDQIRCCQADCSLTAAALVYGAEMKESNRVDTFRNWVDKCKALNPAEAVITVTDDYLTLVEPEVREVEADWIIENLSRLARRTLHPQRRIVASHPAGPATHRFILRCFDLRTTTNTIARDDDYGFWCNWQYRLYN